MDQLEFDDLSLSTFSVDSHRRTMTGVVVPWNSIGRHSNGNRWRFARGSVKFVDAKYVKLTEDHLSSLRFGRAVSAEDTDAGLVMTFKVQPGAHGDRMLAMASDGSKAGLSLGVEIDKLDMRPDPENPGVNLVDMANLEHVSLVKNPAFEDSRLISVMASADQGEDTGMPDTETAPAEKPVYTFSAEQFDALLARIGNPQRGPEDQGERKTVSPFGTNVQVNEPLPYTFSFEHGFRRGPQGYDFSTDLINGGKGNQEARERAESWIVAQFDVDKADTAALSPNINRPDMYVDQMDYVTPLWDFINRGGLDDDRPFVLPKFNSSSGLVAPHTEGVEPAPGAITATTQTITPTGVSGKVEITREAWDRGGNPQLSGILWRQMLREYYEDREAAVATFLNTLTAATDITLTGTPAATPDNDDDQQTVTDLEAALSDLNFVRGGNRFRAFAVHQNLYRVLARVKDDQGRPLYPQIAPQNANGTTSRGYKTIDVGGTTAVGAWALGAAGGTAANNSWLFDPEKVHGWASAPRRLQWDFGATVQTANIPQLAYVTIGIWGYLALANTDINGVRQVIFDPSV